MAEVILPPDSGRIGKSVVKLTFRRKYHLNLIGLRRGQRRWMGNCWKRNSNRAPRCL